ncbi:MBL fold metallo-hydrolase [Aquiflexum sp. TKW24L]|uniref:alkyl sulfatase dimerization domain-containing protein n=1 Tax=Aquiflexum sp. TKW24L TaxID=2942212 RepID=UPI0020C0EA0E|nr:alkyl sulfatase dimerization domain-containing protein [Aquiflexum sp. TKW24L]MCL6259846.1 MBL fold metallo-hydrolase [Aquiflexum sp. TKW24L]
MKKHLLLVWIVAACQLTVSQAQSTLNYPGRYMGQEEVQLFTAPNGAVADAGFAKILQLIYPQPTIEKTAEGIWVIGGYSIANFVVIETDEGLIVIDTGDSEEEGKIIREVIRENISKKPIIAAIYTHSHYCLGTGALVDDPKTAIIIGHKKLNETVQTALNAGGAIAAIPELGPVLSARKAIQFNNFLPDTGEDGLLGGRIRDKINAYLPANKVVENEEIVKIGGMDFQFFTEYKSDDYNLTIWLPKQKVVINNFYWPGIPNLYSIRGASYRDPTEWRDGLQVMRDLKPEKMVNTHARTVSGAKEVFEAISHYMDMVTLVYDQSLRGVLHGLGPDELRYFVYLPKHLADFPNNAQAYGEVPWFTPAAFYHQMGWFDRDVSTLQKLPPVEEAQRTVALMGGRKKVLQAAKTSFGKRELAWAAQLGNYLFTIDPKDAETRKLLADVYRAMGQSSLSMIGRTFFLSEARALEGKEQLPRVVPPKPENIAGKPTFFVDMFRVRIDPRKSENTEKMLVFNFSNGTTAGLHVRRGIAEFVPNPAKHYRPADLTCTVDTKTWADLYLNATTLDEASKSGGVKMTKGSVEDLKAVMDLFDKFDPAKNYTIPVSDTEF